MSAKNKAIKATMDATRKRHADMRCRVFVVKVVSNKLSCEKKQLLNQLFREAKWLRNSELSKGDLDAMDRNAKTAAVKFGSEVKEMPLTLLGSQIRQDVVDSIKAEARGLATKKARGGKVGYLKYKSYCNMIPLRQYGTTYRINFAGNTISVQNMAKYPLKVRGLKQIPSCAEIANAKLVRKASGLYFHITTYVPVDENTPSGACCGIDFGIGNNLTLDDGTVFNIKAPESKSVKLASRRMNKSFHRNGGKKSRRHSKRVNKVRRAYERLHNQKLDAAHKTVATLLRNYDFIAIQDEMIAAWHHGLFGRQVQHSAMGLIKAELKNNSKVRVVPRSFPSTQICPECGMLTKHPLKERVYHCKHCGYAHPSRDAKAALSILMYAIRPVSAERRTQSPVEAGASAAAPATGVCSKLSPTKREAQVL